MHLIKSYFLSSKYIVLLFWFGLIPLTGCSDEKNQTSTNSSSSTPKSSTASSSITQSSSSIAGATDSPYTGEWRAPAYGYILSVSNQADTVTVKTYSVTEDYCLLQDVASNLPLDKFKKSYTYSNNGKESLLQSKGHYPPGVEYERVDHLPEVCRENLQNLKKDGSYRFDAKRDFDIFWQTFNELYINFELREMDWSNVYTDSLNAIEKIKNEDELFAFLSTVITPLGDGHAALLKAPLSQNIDESIAKAIENNDGIFFGVSTQINVHQKMVNEYIRLLEAEGALSGELTAEQISAADEYYLTNYLQMMNIIFSYATEDSEVKVRAAGEIAWFKTTDNIGYLIIGSMAGYDGKSTLASDVGIDLVIAEAAFDEALEDFVDTEGIIIDVRINEGGQDQVALNFVRHFIDKPQFVYSKFSGHGNSRTAQKNVVLEPHVDNIYLKPTAVLVSGDTASAAELFTIAMASLPQVTIIGEPTAGEFSDILVKRLTSDILFGISNETYLDTQGNNYERIGIPVDVNVPFATLQERKGAYDGGIETAIEWIKATP
ncbi:MAG TPA: S41 family peptidase [Cellvibrio sp.]|nr:S41 family peptidase [Cellvibrio sp.]